jgi:MFS transporter, FHS family, glucose/mannose:H+ symporter
MASISSVPPTPSVKVISRWSLAILYLCFVLTGSVTTLLGPILPWLSSSWGLNDAQAGQLFSVQFAVSIVGTVLCSVLIPSLGYRIVLALGAGLMAFGVGGIGAAGKFGGMLLVGCYGFGLGFIIPAMNLLFARLYPARSAAALNLLNFSWTIGAVAWPFLVAPMVSMNRMPLLLYALASAIAIICAYLLAARFDGPRDDSSEKAEGPTWSLAFTGLVLLLALMFYLYVGIENGIGGWLASYAKRTTMPSWIPYATAPAFFWAALMLGRASAPMLLGIVSEAGLVRAGLIMAIVGCSTLLLTHSMTVIAAAAALAGFGLSSIFPILVAWLSKDLGGAAARIGAVMFVMASVGGATLPWMVGVTANHWQNLRVGMAVPLMACVLLWGLQFVRKRSA